MRSSWMGSRVYKTVCEMVRYRTERNTDRGGTEGSIYMEGKLCTLWTKDYGCSLSRRMLANPANDRRNTSRVVCREQGHNTGVKTQYEHYGK